MTRQQFKNDVPEEWRRRERAGLCPVCGKSKPQFDKGQRVFCTVKCREAYAKKYTFWSIVREKILKRDDHTCAECGINSDRFYDDEKNRKQQILTEWIKFNKEQIDMWRDEALVSLDERYREDYDKIMNDLLLADRKMDYDMKEKLFKGVRWRPPSMEVDHRIAVALGGDMWDEDNLRCLCTECHKKKTREDRKKIAAAKRAKGNQTL